MHKSTALPGGAGFSVRRVGIRWPVGKIPAAAISRLGGEGHKKLFLSQKRSAAALPRREFVISVPGVWTCGEAIQRVKNGLWIAASPGLRPAGPRDDGLRPAPFPSGFASLSRSPAPRSRRRQRRASTDRRPALPGWSLPSAQRIGCEGRQAKRFRRNRPSGDPSESDSEQSPLIGEANMAFDDHRQQSG